MFPDFLEFLKAEWRLISDNAWTFIIFGVFIFVIGLVISWRLNNYFIAVRLHDLPARERLQEEKSKLEDRIQELEKELHKKKVTDMVQQYKEPRDTSIGVVVAQNTSAANTEGDNK